MPQLKTITINDGAATPVPHSFTPTGISSIDNGEVSTLNERTGVPFGNPSLLISVKDPGKGGVVYRVSGTLRVPIVQDQVVNGIANPTVVRSAEARFEFLLPQNGVEAERKNIRVLLANLLANADVVAAVEKVEHFF